MRWKEIPEDVEKYQGFVYLIEELDTGKKYIGKKNIWKQRKRKVKGK